MNDRICDPEVCETLAEDLVAFVDGELDDAPAAVVRGHLAICAACRALAEELGLLSTEIRKLPRGGEAIPSAGFTNKTESFIRAHAARAQAATAEQAQAKAPVKAPAKAPPPPRRPWFLSPRFGVAMAAGVFLVLIGVAFLGPLFQRLGSSSANALAGRQENGAIEQRLYAHKNLRGFGSSEQVGPVYSGAPAHEASPRAQGGVDMRNRYEPKPADDPAPSPSPAFWHEEKGRRPSPGGVVFKSPQRRVGSSGIGPGRLAGDGDDEGDGFAAAGDGSGSLAPLGQIREANKNAWYESDYQAGAGERERLEKLVAAGVVVDGQKLKLGAFTRNYHQDFPVPARRALALDAALDHSRILTAGGEVFLQVGIQASKREMARRPPLNIALVIDRSGSMGEGNKMDSARRAALRFLRDLRDDDRAIVIAYDDRVELARAGREPASRQAMIRFVEKLHPRGATNIHGALDRAYRELAKTASPELINTVMLLSDGLPTAGVTNTAAIVDLSSAAAEHGISTTTIGMGLDYNDALMMDAARRGQGHYHFVRDAASVEAIFKAEFASLNRVVARALRLRIRLANDVVLTRVLGSRELSGAEQAQVRREEQHIDRKVYEELGIKTDRERDDEDGIRMMIPYFFSGDSHVVLLQLQVPPGVGDRRLAEVTLKYKDMLHSKNGMDEREAVIHYTARDADVVASISRPVKKNLLGYRASAALLQAADLVSTGRERQAARVIAEQTVLFREAGRAWNDAQLTRDAELLEQYQQVIGSLDAPALAGKTDLRAYLQKTLSHSAYTLTR